MSYMYIFTYTSFCMCIFICANICMDSPMGNSLAPVSISLDKYGGRKCPYQSYHRNLEAWSFFLPFQKVTNKKLTEIPSSIQKNHHPAAKFEAVFVFLVPFFFPPAVVGNFQGATLHLQDFFGIQFLKLSVGVQRMGWVDISTTY